MQQQKRRSLRAVLTGLPTGEQVELSADLRRETLSSILPRLAPELAATLGERSNLVVSSGGRTKLVDPLRITLGEIDAFFGGQQGVEEDISVHVNVNARGGESREA